MPLQLGNNRCVRATGVAGVTGQVLQNGEINGYQPIADILWEKGVTVATAPEMATRIQRELQSNSGLERTPVILSLGLGASYIMPLDRHARWDSGVGALTLLDKIGVALWKYRGDSNTFQTGLFAGGFLDALVRTAASGEEENRSWLLGYAVGFPRLAGMEFGLEAHVAMAMPFALSETEDYGWCSGAAVVVPMSLLLTDEE